MDTGALGQAGQTVVRHVVLGIKLEIVHVLTLVQQTVVITALGTSLT